MDKKDYFYRALEFNCHHSREWLVDVLGITTYDDTSKLEYYPYRMATKKDGTKIAFVPNGSGGYDEEPITGSVNGEPLIGRNDPLTIDHYFGVPGYTDQAPLETTYRCVILNMILCAYPFGDRIPFINNPFSFKKLESIISAKFSDLPEEGKERSPDLIYYDDYLKYTEAVDLIRGIGYLVNPSGSRGTFTVSPEVIALRNELVEKHKHEINNPAILSMIAQQLEEKDRESLKGDISEGFFVGGKLWAVARMKTFIMQGLEPTLSTEIKPKPILTSLVEGWKVEDIPDMINGQRYGSYSRGKLTEFGGVVVKLISQATRDMSIVEDDCGDNNGIPIKIHSNYHNLLVGQYIVGEDNPVTPERLTELNLKVVRFRSPASCKVTPPGYCKKCIGTRYSANPRGLSTAATRQGSIFMGIFMAKMHGKPLRTKPLNFETAFS